MNDEPVPRPEGGFTLADFRELSRYVIDRWTAGIDLDWNVQAGTLEWTCIYTADHVVDCVFSYAFFLASAKLDGYPRFGELHALADAGPSDMIDGLRATTTMLAAVVAAAEPDAVATIWYSPLPELRGAADFAARGALEMILHAHDVCTGLGVVFEPPADLCRRLFDHTSDWPMHPAMPPAADAWSALLERSGRRPD
jgi:hypothetical protein